MAAEDTWTYKADIPTVRDFVSGCVLDGKIYVIGGFPSHYSVTPVNEMYDPTNDTWTRMADMPSARCGHATCTFDDKIYVFGGVSPDGYSSAKNNVYVYDPQTDTWTQKADMPYANAFCGIAVVNEIIYLIGGTTKLFSPPISTVMAYDPVTESWTQKADMPTARASLSACVVDGKIYTFGGADQNLRTYAYTSVEVYGPATNTWTTKTDMPTSRFGLGTCAMNEKIYAVGGVTNGLVVITANEMYDPASDTWATKSPLQERRQTFFLGSVGNKIYAIGGSYPDPQNPSEPVIPSSTEEYDTGLTVSSPDFNGDGIVDIQDLLLLIESWGQDDPLCDIAPPPFGDGIVDALDLELLMSHWGQPVDDPTLIAHWALDEAEGTVAYDSSGVNDAFVIGGTEWQPGGGQVDGALQLDGVDGCAVSGPVLNPADGPFSVVAWVNGGAPGQVVVSQQGAANWLMADAVGNLMTELKGTGRSAGPLQSQTIITDGHWHRVGFVMGRC